MAKGKGSDFIEEVHQRSQHNINPYYWFNRVDNFEFAEWNASLAFSVIESAVFILATIFTIVMTIADGNPRLFLLAGFLALVGLIPTVRAIKWFSIRRQHKLVTRSRPKERKKKLPRHRKDYGRN